VAAARALLLSPLDGAAIVRELRGEKKR